MLHENINLSIEHYFCEIDYTIITISLKGNNFTNR